MSIIQTLGSPIRKLISLNDHPVVCQTKNFTVVGFGVFAAIEAVVILMFLYVYLVAAGYHLHHIPAFALPLVVTFVWFGARGFHWWALGRKFWHKPKKYLNETGFYLQGGLLGGMLSVLIFAPFAQVPIAVLADALALGVLLGQVVGRLGCYNYGCCFGKPTQTALGVRYSHKHSKVGRWRKHWLHIRLHPTQLYMVIQNILGFAIIMVFATASITPGVVFYLVMVWEGCARLCVEPLRADMSFSEGRNWRTVQVASCLALVGAVGAAWLLLTENEIHSSVVFSGAGQKAFVQWLSSPNLWLINFSSILFIFVGYGVHGKQIGTFPVWSTVLSDLKMRLRARLTKVEKRS